VVRTRGRGAHSKGEKAIKDSVTNEGPKPQKSIEGWVIFVRNVHEEAHEDDVHDLFSEYGEIKNINLNLERRSGFAKGYALIEYHTKEEAEKAIEEMNDKEFREKVLSVDWAFVDGPLNNDYTNFSGASASYITPAPAPRGKRPGGRGGNRGGRRLGGGSELGRRKRSPSPQRSRKKDKHN